MANAKQKFTRKRALTLPLLKLSYDVPVYAKITGEMKIGKAIGDKDAAIVAPVVNVETGEEMEFLVPAVLQGIFHDEYGAPKYGVPKKGEPTQELEPRRDGLAPDSYVGKIFEITKHKKAAGKSYNPHTVYEVEA